MPGARDLQVRPAVPADYSEFLRFFAELGVPDPPPDCERWESERMPDTRFFAAGDALVAYAYFEVMGAIGFVRNVVVDPAFRNRGIGREVMHELGRQLTAAGCSELCLNVTRVNDAAIRVYESVGLRRAYPSASLRLDWTRIDDVRDPNDAVDARASGGSWPVIPVLSEDDALVEHGFELPTGVLASRRRRDGMLLLGVCIPRHAGNFAAFASFDPEFGGAYPFCAKSAAVARALLHRMRVHAGDANAVLLVVENNALLENALLEAGAESVLSLWHYRGPL